MNIYGTERPLVLFNGGKRKRLNGKSDARTYVITTIRTTSGDESNHLNGFADLVIVA
jgi:hypothetical protein